MSNHIHFVAVLTDSGRGAVTSPLLKATLGKIIGYYKNQTTKEVNKLRKFPGSRFWQRNYYERVLRNEMEFEAIYDYIETNPANWEEDEYRTK